MSIGLSALSGGLQIFQALGSYKAAKEKAESDRKWQKYNNKMVRINNALNQNTITTNHNMRKTRSAMEKLQIDQSEFATTGKVEVAAAATGTVGRSVNAILRDVRGNASTARATMERDDEWQDLGDQNQRMMSNFSAEQSIDLRTIPKPSMATTLLGLAQTGLENRDTLSSLWTSVKSRV